MTYMERMKEIGREYLAVHKIRVYPALSELQTAEAALDEEMREWDVLDDGSIRGTIEVPGFDTRDGKPARVHVELSAAQIAEREWAMNRLWDGEDRAKYRADHGDDLNLINRARASRPGSPPENNMRINYTPDWAADPKLHRQVAFELQTYVPNIRIGEVRRSVVGIDCRGGPSGHWMAISENPAKGDPRQTVHPSEAAAKRAIRKRYLRTVEEGG